MNRMLNPIITLASTRTHAHTHKHRHMTKEDHEVVEYTRTRIKNLISNSLIKRNNKKLDSMEKNKG